jgi:glycosyltransferase involved in cell wall biosynthesis
LIRERPKILSVVVNFFNMRREAARTLCSLTPAYQQDIDPAVYEVIAIDNGSSEPLDESWVRSLGDNFRYIYYDTESKSPCAAINRAVEAVESQIILCMIDGARLLSPGVLKYSLSATQLYEHPFIYTLAMHVGKQTQNVLVAEGYNQATEDALLDSIDWKSHGYRLFEISCVASLSKKGFFSQRSETNCFTMKRQDYLSLGGLDERFVSPGGGIANLDFFKRVHEDSRYSPVMLLGEATFHQFHGGVATNVPLEMHPLKEMEKEYKAIKGKDYRSSFRYPLYFGSVPVECLPFMKGD